MNIIPLKYKSLVNSHIEDTYKKYPKFYITFLIVQKMIEDSGNVDIHCKIDYTRSSYFIRVWKGDEYKDEYGFTKYPNELYVNREKVCGILEVRYFRSDTDVTNDQIEQAILTLKNFLNNGIE